MTSAFDILVDSSSIRQGVNGRITGVVFWQINELCFPDNPWNDFIITVLNWWVEGAAKLAMGASTIETLLFMDGPYSVNCWIEGQTIWIQPIDRRRKELLTRPISATTNTFHRRLFEVASQTIKACHHNGIYHSGIDSLERNTLAYGQLIANSKT